MWSLALPLALSFYLLDIIGGKVVDGGKPKMFPVHLQVCDVSGTTIDGDGGRVQPARRRWWSTVSPSTVGVLWLLHRHRRFRQHPAKYCHVCHGVDCHRTRDVTGLWRLLLSVAESADVPNWQQLHVVHWRRQSAQCSSWSYTNSTSQSLVIMLYLLYNVWIVKQLKSEDVLLPETSNQPAHSNVVFKYIKIMGRLQDAGGMPIN